MKVILAAITMNAIIIAILLTLFNRSFLIEVSTLYANYSLAATSRKSNGTENRTTIIK